MITFEYENLNKQEFLHVNNSLINDTITQINSKIDSTYEEHLNHLTSRDIWVITYCEAGIDTEGHISPHFEHSLGEIGFYPLPSNIKSWNGNSAPQWNQPTSIEENIHHYYLYMGHLKNKIVKTYNEHLLYRDLFQNDASTESSTRNAKLLAGVVHGYFFKGKYSDNEVPFDYLLAGYNTDQNLSEMLKSTNYKHAGTSIIENRRINIGAALDAYDSFFSTTIASS